MRPQTKIQLFVILQDTRSKQESSLLQTGEKLKNTQTKQKNILKTKTVVTSQTRTHKHTAFLPSNYIPTLVTHPRLSIVHSNFGVRASAIHSLTRPLHTQRLRLVRLQHEQRLRGTRIP